MKDKRLVLIYAIVLIDVIVGSAIMPILPVFVTQHSSPALLLSIANGLFMTMQLLSSPILGALSDRFGRKPIFIASSIGTFLMNFLLLPVRTWALMLNRIGDGTTNGLYAAVRSAITDISEKKDLFKNMGIEGTIISAALIIGPAISGIMLHFLDLNAQQQTQAVVYMIIVFSFLNIVLSFLLPETHKQQKGGVWKDVKAHLIESLNIFSLLMRLREKSKTKKGLWRIALMQLCLTLGLGYYFYFAAYLSASKLNMNAKDISYFFIYFGVLSLLTYWIYFSYIIHKINANKIVITLLIVGGFLMVAYAYVGNLGSVWWFYVVLTVDALSLSFVSGTLEGMIAHLTTDDDRGEIFGITQALAGLASVVSIAVMGALSIWGIVMPFYWFALCFFATAAIAYFGDETK